VGRTHRLRRVRIAGAIRYELVDLERAAFRRLTSDQHLQVDDGRISTLRPFNRLSGCDRHRQNALLSPVEQNNRGLSGD
jgi:hypothetical protein